MVISEIRTRGASGAGDQFVELFNATPSPVTLDSSWSIQGRPAAATSYAAHWVGHGQVVPAWGHFLVVGPSYAESPPPDDFLAALSTDAGGLRLVQGTTVVDTVCFYFDAATLAALDASFGCPGTPVNDLPHDNTSSATSDVDASIARSPGGGLGNCTDTGNNAADFIAEMPATPMDTMSPPTP